jgi:TPR repeat protein
MQKSAQTFLGVLTATLVVVGTAVAGPFEDAISAYGRGDNTTATRLFHPLAEEGRADAQTRLGAMYDNGNGVARDYAECPS